MCWRWKDSVQPPQFLALQSKVRGTADISSLSQGLLLILKPVLDYWKKCSKVKRKCPFQPNHQLEKMRLDFVFQDMTFELDVNPLSAFKHLHTLDLNFYDNHRYFILQNLKNLTSKQKLLLEFRTNSEKVKFTLLSSGTHFLIRFWKHVGHKSRLWSTMSLLTIAP